MKAGYIKLLWISALVLYAICWVLPILDGGKETYIGYDGTELAHTEFWKLVTGARDDRVSIIGAIFISLGWLPNELFLLGLLAAWQWPQSAHRIFAVSLGIMLSWQILFHENFPLLIGYWCWIASAVIALSLSVTAEARRTGRSHAQILADPVALIGFGVPIVNAVAGVVTGDFK